MIEPEIRKELTKKTGAMLFAFVLVEVLKIASQGTSPDETKTSCKEKAVEIVNMVLATTEAEDSLNALIGKKEE